MSQLITELYKRKENNRLEVKRAREGVPQTLWETYSSFANTMGGTIILGVDEDTSGNLQVAGVPDAERYVKTIWNTLNNRQKVSRNILVEHNIRLEETEGKNVIVIGVPRAARTDKPIFINGDVYSGSYRRNGDGDYHCSEDEVRNMIRDSSRSPADLVVLEALGLDALCADTIQKYRRRLATVKPDLSWNQLSDEELLYRLNAIGRSEKDAYLHPTAAGLLMFGYHYEIVKEFPSYLLDYREVTDEESRWVDRIVSNAANWSGNLFDFYFLVAEKLMVGIKTPFALDENMVRIDDTPVHKAVREALVNSLVHANYYERRGLVVIKRKNSFEFSNPGGLRICPEAAIDGGLSDPRNGTVFTMFMLINIGERADSGLSNIFAVWKQQKWIEPILSETFNPERTALNLVMGKASGEKVAIKSGDKKVAIKSGDKELGKKTEEQRNQIIEYLRKNKECTNAIVCELLNIRESRARIILGQMVEDGLLVAKGENKGRVYRIAGL
ncbi:RNA-binding domain-containing protein [Parasphaerochaeta coccoides]|uniref:Transcriptional regulator n=1 Tax=Parasphaerochaeta coccoides (strain ATCC BAA-1237 / DSM 17374 / SPN1) TaxID=760011 RepID=F4GL19_PARC1|nr:RNA-binding domain-containing protein [Parasphaerochaeta coccoides]AEC02359.1 putative transcriptional regulator [Parasphaerochaeta coccoides DSM 17374]